MGKQEYLIKQAGIHEAKSIYELMVNVYEDLEDKEVFVCDSLEYVEQQLKKSGFAVVAYDHHNKMVGSFIFRYPRYDEDNLGLDLGLRDKELMKVVHMESAVVSPEHRGKQLQSKMLEYGEGLINTSEYKYFMATVSPRNIASLHTFLKNGYENILQKEKYHGMQRIILQKKLDK